MNLPKIVDAMMNILSKQTFSDWYEKTYLPFLSGEYEKGEKGYKTEKQVRAELTAILKRHLKP